MAPPPSTPVQGSNQLPQKEQQLFRNIVKCYETKQYKKGMKAADQILKKFPDHGETLAMKGLTLNCLDRKTEAYELVREGLRKDLRSHVCWHVLGLLYRSDRDYKEAIKAYRQALRIDPDNMQILRDLTTLQVQVRDASGLLESRRTLLQAKPTQRSNWIGFALAYYVSGDYSGCLGVLNTYEKTLEQIPPEGERYEYSELVLFKADLLDKNGDKEGAIQQIRSQSAHIIDKVSMQEMLGRLLIDTSQSEEAKSVFYNLIESNPDNYEYHDGLLESMGLFGPRLEDAQAKELGSLYDSLLEKHPRSSVARRFPLNFVEGDVFRSSIQEYITRKLRKGVPSLFSDLRPLYKYTKCGRRKSTWGKGFGNLRLTFDPRHKKSREELVERRVTPIDIDRGQVIGEILNALVDRSSSNASAFSENGSDEDSAACYIWALHTLAQHYAEIGDSAKALSTIEKAIQHTPTIPELYSCKSDILLEAGATELAAEFSEFARTMDLADRYLNNDAVCKLLLCSKFQKAEQIVALFTKDGNQVNNLYDMQAAWYELATANAYLRGGRQSFGKALKYFSSVLQHFEDIHEDQFDFHGYCLRKMTLRAYSNFLEMEDNLYAHPFYVEAATKAIEMYIELDSEPKEAEKLKNEEEMIASMSVNERKKYRAKQRKLKKQQADMAAKDKPSDEGDKSSKEKDSSGGKKPHPWNVDCDGAELIKDKNFVDEAMKIVNSMRQFGYRNPEVHVISYKVFKQRKKVALMWYAAKNAYVLNKSGAKPNFTIIDFVRQFEEEKKRVAAGESSCPQVLIDTISKEIQEILDGKDSKTLAKEFVESSGRTSVYHAEAAGRLIHAGLADGSSTDLLVSSRFEETESHDDCVYVHQLISDSKDIFSSGPASEEIAQAWKEKCRLAFPFSDYFGGSARESVVGLEAFSAPDPSESKAEQAENGNE